MAKPFAETVNIQPQTISTGQAQFQMGLAEKLDSFASQTAQFVARKQVESATVEGQKAAQGLQPGQVPEFKEETFVGGIAKKAYNSALRSSYVAGVDRDLTLSLNALKVEHGSDLTAFNDAANAEIKGSVEAVDPATRDLILQSANDFMDSARIDVQKNTIEKNMAEADTELLTSGEFYSSNASTFAFNGDKLSSSESLSKVFTINQSRVESGTISQLQAAQLNDVAVHSSRVAQNRGEFNTVMTSGPDGIQNAAAGLNALRETQLPGMSIEQHDQLVNTLNSDLNQHIALLNKQEVADQASLTVKQNNNYSQMLVDFAEGNMDQTQLNNAARTGAISGSQFDKMTTKLSSQGVGVTDISLQLGIQMSIIEGNDETAAIVENMGLFLNQADAGALFKMQQEYSNKESVLNANPTKRARSFMTQSMKVTGILGNLTDDAAQKTASAVREFDQRVLEGEDAMVVADDLYDRDTLIKLDSQMSRKFDTNDVRGSIGQLTEQFRADAATFKGAELENIKNKFNRELKLLQELQALQKSQEQFNSSLKELK